MKPASARVGIIVPSSNTSVEIELPQALPAGVSVHAARLPQVTDVRLSSVHEMAAEIETQARLLATASVDLILVAATVPTLVHGLDWDRKLITSIERDTGIRTTTATTEMVASLKAVGARRLVLGTPFIAEMNQPIVRFLGASGFEVLADYGMGIADNLAIGRLPAQSAVEVARKIDNADADAILFVCTNWAILSAISEVERRHGKPVIGVTQACLRGVLSILGHSPGAGSGRFLKRAEIGSATGDGREETQTAP
jgi:maleate isomerase